MAQLTGFTNVSSQDLYTSRPTPAKDMMIGQMGVDARTGKFYRYALAGGTALVAGNLLQEAANDTTYANMAVGTAGAVGDKYIQVTNGTATITSEQFRGGTIHVYTAGTVPVGDEYNIVRVTGTLTTGGALKVYVDRPLRYAFTTSAKVNMKRSPWSGVIVFPTTQTGIPAGVAIYPIAADEYGWVQTHGPAAALSDGSTFAVGSSVSSGSGTAGCVTVGSVATTDCLVGYAREVSASAKAICVFLQID